MFQHKFTDPSSEAILNMVLVRKEELKIILLSVTMSQFNLNKMTV